MITEPGIYIGLTAAEYFAIPAFHKSWYSATMKSAKHLKHEMETDIKTGAKVLGSLVDALILEPSELEDFPVLPATYTNSKGKEMPFNMRSTSCKETYQAMIDAGQTPIKAEQLAEARAIRDGVMDNTAAEKLLDDSQKQVAIVWEDAETGILCKGRIDAQTPKALIDLKTTRSALLWPFSGDVVKFGYHVQAAMYLDGWTALNGGDAELDWYFITVENVAPYCCAVYHLDPESIQAGRIRYKMALQRYKGYLEDDPEFLRGYSDFIEPLKIPTWEIEKAFTEGDNNEISI